jgi:microcystin-dependent protein
MTVISPPTFIAGECYEARSFRHMLQAAANGSPGVVVGLNVASVSGLNVTFDPGSCIVAGDTFPEGYYQVVVSAAETVAISPSNPTLSRIDLIIARVKTTEYGDATDTATVEVVTGTAAATPVAPTPGFDRWFELATVTVPAGASSLLSTNVVPTRVRAGSQTVPVGAITMFAGATAPSGYLICDGSSRNRADFPALFTEIGTTYGPGSVPGTTFNVPDLRGRTPVGAGTGTGLTTRTLGFIGGAESVVLTTAQMPTHSHGGTVTGGAHTHDLASVITAFAGNTWNIVNGNGWALATRTTVAGQGSHSHTIASDGGGGSHPNMQPWLAVNFIIRSS